MFLFWVFVVIVVIAALIAVAAPVLFWWALGGSAETADEDAAKPKKVVDLLNPAVWPAFLKWIRERPRRLEDRRKK